MGCNHNMMSIGGSQSEERLTFTMHTITTTTTTTGRIAKTAIQDVLLIRKDENVSIQEYRNQKSFSFFKENATKKIGKLFAQIIGTLFGKTFSAGQESFHMCEIPVIRTTVLDTIPLKSCLEEIPLFTLVTWHLVLSPRFRSNLVHCGEHAIYAQYVTTALKRIATNTYSNTYLYTYLLSCLKANVHNVIGVICSFIVFSNLIWAGLVGKRPWCHGKQPDFCKDGDFRVEWYTSSAWNERLQKLSHIKALHVI